MAASRQSAAVASVAHKLVLSSADMPPALCRCYCAAEHVHRTTTVHSAAQFTFGARFDISSVLHAVQLVPVRRCSSDSSYGLSGLLHELVSAVSSVVPEL